MCLDFEVAVVRIPTGTVHYLNNKKQTADFLTLKCAIEGKRIKIKLVKLFFFWGNWG